MTYETYISVLDRLAELIKDTRFENNVYAVGGCVRDSIIGREIKDIDLVVSIENGGTDIASELYKGRHLAHQPVIYETYGTAMFRLKDFPDLELEAVQTRKEQYHSDSRNPETSFGTIEEDVMRRDLTINAIYYNVSTRTMLDLTNGQEDIERRIIRVTSTPDIVYEDDPLRILRAIRFYGQLNTGVKDPGNFWVIDMATFEGMKSHSHRLTIISKERFATEFHKMLLTDYPSECLELLRKTGAMHFVIPELEETYDMTQNEYHFGTVWEHTLKVVDNASQETRDLNVMMAAVLHDIGKIKTRSVKDGKVHFYEHERASENMIPDILRALKEPVEMIKEVSKLAGGHMMAKPWKDDLSGVKNIDRSVRKLQYRYGKDMFEKLMIVIDADNKAHAEGHCLPYQVKNIREVSERLVATGKDMFEYRLPVTGDDIMEVRQIKPSREVRRCLDYLIKLAFNKPEMTRDEFLKAAKSFK